MKPFTKTIFIFFLFGIILPAKAQTWITLITDASGDGINKDLPDGLKLEYYYNQAADSLWFKVIFEPITTTKTLNLGVNIMVLDPQAVSTFNFWGFDNAKKYSRLLSAYMAGPGPASTLGIADADGINASPKDFTNLYKDNLDVKVSASLGIIEIGMKRGDFIPDSATGKQLKIAAAVGSSVSWNDDIYSPTATMSLPVITGIENTGNLAFIKAYPNPATDYIIISGNEDAKNYTVLDATGKEAGSGTLTENHRIPVSNLPAGLYFIQLSGENNQAVFTRLRFIKN